MIEKGIIKVMTNRKGETRIQEELDGTIKTYTPAQWQRVLNKRRKHAANDTEEQPQGEDKIELPEQPTMEEIEPAPQEEEQTPNEQSNTEESEEVKATPKVPSE